MIGKDINMAASLLTAGEIVGIPTETVYGLAANALDEVAVSKIFTIKNRPTFDPLIIHTSSIERMMDYVVEVPDPLLKLAQVFMPGPLTLLLPKKENISDLVTAGSSQVAVRIPDHRLTRSLLKLLPFPLAAPSANPFGYISPTTAWHVDKQLGEKIPYILDGGSCLVGVESTIVGINDDKVTVFRKGGISLEKIRAVIGEIEVITHSSSNPAAPGMLENHYASRHPLVIDDVDKILPRYETERVGVIVFKKPVDTIPIQNQIILSPTGNFEEAARNLFSGMRTLDALDLDVILAFLLPEEDLGVAINDRLRRASV